MERDLKQSEETKCDIFMVRTVDDTELSVGIQPTYTL